MNKEDFIEIGIDTCVFDEYDNGAVFACTISVDDWIVCMRAVEQATLERAAKIAETCDLHEGDYLRNSDPRKTIAHEIRADMYD